VLYFGKPLFIPLSFALLISCVLYPVCEWFEKKGISKSFAILIAETALFIFIGAIVYLLLMQFSRFASEWEPLKLKLSESLTKLGLFLESSLNINQTQQQAWFKRIADSTGVGLFSYLQATFYSFSVAAVLTILIPIFSALILYHRQRLVKALYSLFDERRSEMIHIILHDTILTYYNFIKGMCIVYIVVGILNSIGLALLGIPHPILFGFIASILTFIPYIGIIVASLLPITISWLTYDSLWYPFGVIVIFTVVQYLEANVIFPFAVSNRLKVNTLATIVAIIAGGILWGAAGMILFVPFLGMLKLIADKTPELKALSIFLGYADSKKRNVKRD
jgi:predicted PurR-regulated permease PerM